MYDRLINRRALVAAFALFVAATVPSFAADPAPAAAPPTKTLQWLRAEDVEPGQLLPPPAAAASPEQQADLAALRDVIRTRTPERYAQAKWDDEHEDASIFAATIGDGFNLSALPATAELLKLVQHEQSVAANMAKRYFLRPRPWAVDTTIVACDFKLGKPPLTSYPSGHATLGYSVGFVLAALIPEKAQAIQARAKDYAYSREVCGAHYHSDTEASHALGVAVATRLLTLPALQSRIEAARRELRTARLTG
ncbi:phosphatase PAP2 family protein [Roseiterribacter gracilis]|uniref:Acid phosphatase n=1 Tax=Roseiterribacter gracilis TaxID=2812848 RepID=A0A8S8XA02_9PROT|nr:acid phosphatase [Rhodospirillales bacterium TMPK1]